MITNITSPSRGEKYTLEEVLRKGIERSALKLDSWEFKKLHECFFHSIDGVIVVDRFRCSESVWNESVGFQINGSIPVHFTEGGKMNIGFGCGDDFHYHSSGETEPDKPAWEPDNPMWEEYKTTTTVGVIKIYTETETQKLNLADAMQDEKAMKVLAEILQRKIAEGAILGFWEKD